MMRSLKVIVYKFLLLSGILIFSSNLSAQKIEVIPTTPLNFGKFFKTSGGNIIIDPITGPDPNPTGDIFIVNEGYRGIIVVTPSNLMAFQNKKVIVTVTTPSVNLNSIIPLIVDVHPKSFQFDQNSLDPKVTIYVGGTLQVGGNEHPVGIYNNINDLINIRFEVVNQ